MKESKYKDYRELPVFLNARMVADLLGVSQSTAYELMHEKSFPTLQVRSRLVVPKDAFLDWMNGKVSR